MLICPADDFFYTFIQVTSMLSMSALGGILTDLLKVAIEPLYMAHEWDLPREHGTICP